MELNEFIKNFANQFDETDMSEFKADTEFRELDEWSSLTGMGVMTMVKKKYGVTLTVADLRGAKTIEELYNAVRSK